MDKAVGDAATSLQGVGAHCQLTVRESSERLVVQNSMQAQDDTSCLQGDPCAQSGPPPASVDPEAGS